MNMNYRDFNYQELQSEIDLNDLREIKDLRRRVSISLEKIVDDETIDPEVRGKVGVKLLDSLIRLEALQGVKRASRQNEALKGISDRLDESWMITERSRLNQEVN